jgi:phosphoribosylanthranilate isomerase
MDSPMEIIQNIASLTSWQDIIFLLASTIVGGLYINSSAKSKAEEVERKANKAAIDALQLQVTIQQEQIKYLKDALLEIGIRVTMDGKIMHIHKNEHKEEA